LGPTRARLNDQRSPASRIRDGRQIVALRDDRCAEAALLHDRRGGIVGSGRAAYVYSWGLRGRPGCCRGGRDILRGRLVGVAAREGAFAVSLQGRAAADLLVVGELAEGVGGTAAVESVSICRKDLGMSGFRELTILLRRWYYSFRGGWPDRWRLRQMSGLVVGCCWWRRLLLGRCLRRMFGLGRGGL